MQNFSLSQMCRKELNLVREMFHDIFNVIILIELERVPSKDLPSTLRLLMATQTYLECNVNVMNRFWERLIRALGTPLLLDRFDHPPENSYTTETNLEETEQLLA
jgi:hypothetical protein